MIFLEELTLHFFIGFKVKTHDFVSIPEEFSADFRADQTGGAGHKTFFHFFLPSLKTGEILCLGLKSVKVHRAYNEDQDLNEEECP